MAEDDLIALIAGLADRDSSDVVIGIGDDAAVLDIPEDHLFVTCTDTLVAGVHFPQATSASSVGFKSLAVNLSDMAAMGATPRWAQLSLTLPAADESWVREFISGFLKLADRANVTLVGGDTCSGPLSITVQVMGIAAKGKVLNRGTASPGELLAVSGWLGDAAFVLRQLGEGQSVPAAQLRRLNEPEPRLGLGSALAGIASSCIDISDGLMLDLERLLRHSGCGARVELESLPVSEYLSRIPAEQRQELQLAGGDDYELCFSIPSSQLTLLDELATRLEIPVSVIGKVTNSPGISCYDENGVVIELNNTGFQHF